jgi:caffeic acid 3-O-methyltransferase
MSIFSRIFENFLCVSIYVQFILHGSKDKRCVTILRNCYQALSAHGKVIAVDNMLPEIIDFEGANPLALQCDIHMMAYGDASGREQTERHLRELGLVAGFKQVKFICKVDAMAVTKFRELASAA